MHLFAGVEFPFTKDFVLSLTLRGVSRQALHTPCRAPPVTPELLVQVSQILGVEGDPVSSTLYCAYLFAFFPYGAIGQYCATVS